MVVYRLDDSHPAPPPRPPAANRDIDTGLDVSGSGLVTFSRMYGPYSYYADVDFTWTTAAFYSAVSAGLRWPCHCAIVYVLMWATALLPGHRRQPMGATTLRLDQSAVHPCYR